MVAIALQARSVSARQPCGDLVLDGASSATFVCSMATRNGGTGSQSLQFSEQAEEGTDFTILGVGVSSPASCLCKAASPLKTPRFGVSREFVCTTGEGGLSVLVTGSVVGKGPGRVLMGVQMLSLSGIQSAATGKCRVFPVVTPTPFVTPTPPMRSCGPNPGPTSCDTIP